MGIDSQDDFLTPAEAAYLDEDGGVSAEEEEIFENEDQVAGKEAPESPAGEANEGDPIAEHTPENEVAGSAEEKPAIRSDRYPDVVMTDTVPPELEIQLNALAARFDESEIDITQFLKERAAIDRQITQYQIQEANQQRTYNSWMDAQDAFLTENRQYINNNIMYGALDTAVREIQADPRSKGMSPSQIMLAADYLVKDSFGIKQETKQPSVKQEEKPKFKPNELPSVPTLSTIPASSQNETGIDPFSAIDRLTGDAKEAALLRLTPEQYESYLRA